MMVIQAQMENLLNFSALQTPHSITVQYNSGRIIHGTSMFAGMQQMFALPDLQGTLKH